MKPPREFWKRPEGFITHARGHYLWAPLRTGKKRTKDRQGGGNGRVEVERKEVETKKKKKKEERPISSAVEFHERAIAADVRSAEELCGREIPRE